jgi:hypothetical protein
MQVNIHDHTLEITGENNLEIFGLKQFNRLQEPDGLVFTLTVDNIQYACSTIVEGD